MKAGRQSGSPEEEVSTLPISFTIRYSRHFAKLSTQVLMLNGAFLSSHSVRPRPCRKHDAAESPVADRL